MHSWTGTDRLTCDCQGTVLQAVPIKQTPNRLPAWSLHPPAAAAMDGGS